MVTTTSLRDFVGTNFADNTTGKISSKDLRDGMFLAADVMDAVIADTEAANEQALGEVDQALTDGLAAITTQANNAAASAASALTSKNQAEAAAAAQPVSAMHIARELLSLPAEPRLIMLPTKKSYYAGYPTEGGTLSSDLLAFLSSMSGSFSRPGPATRINAQGVLETVAANVPRIDYDPDTLALRGLRMEGASTNLAWLTLNQNSETFIGGAGMPSGNVTKGYAAPDGSNNATLCVEDTTNGEHFPGDISIPVVAGEIYVWSFFVKEPPFGAKRYMSIRTATAVSATSVFDAASGTWLSGSGYNLRGAEKYPNGVWRIWLCVTATSTTNLIARVQLHSGTSPVYAGDGVSGMIVWGRQLEKVPAARGPSSYIPALTAQTTRAAETMSMNMANVVNLTEGSMLLDFIMEHNSVGVTIGTLQKVSLGQNSIYFSVGSTGALGAASYRAGAAQAGSGTINFGTYTPYQLNKVAASFKDGAPRASRNGGAAGNFVTAGSFLMPDLSGATMAFGSASAFYWIRGFKYFAVALTDAQLQAITA